MIYSSSFIFALDIDGHKKGKLVLKNNLLYGKTGLAKMSFNHDVKHGRAQASTLKELKKIVKLTSLKNIIKKPVFVESLQSVQVFDNNRKGRRSFYFNYLKPANFQLASDSPGQGKGVKIAEHPAFQKNTDKNDELGAAPKQPE